MKWFRSHSRPAPSPVGPTFILLGANKGGTTSLWKYLDQHPDVYMSRVKEPMYFSSIPEEPKGRTDDRWRVNAVRTWSEYTKLFEPGRKFSARGEASTGYLRNEQVPARMHSELPDIQLAAILRNPFDRALSHYKMYQRLDMESLTFSEAIEAELNARLWVLNLSDGEHSLLDIADRSGIPFSVIHYNAELLRQNGLLSI